MCNNTIEITRYRQLERDIAFDLRDRAGIAGGGVTRGFHTVFMRKLSSRMGPATTDETLDTDAAYGGDLSGRIVSWHCQLMHKDDAYFVCDALQHSDFFSRHPK